MVLLDKRFVKYDNYVIYRGNFVCQYPPLDFVLGTLWYFFKNFLQIDSICKKCATFSTLFKTFLNGYIMHSVNIRSEHSGEISRAYHSLLAKLNNVLMDCWLLSARLEMNLVVSLVGVDSFNPPALMQKLLMCWFTFNNRFGFLTHCGHRNSSVKTRR